MAKAAEDKIPDVDQGIREKRASMVWYARHWNTAQRVSLSWKYLPRRKRRAVAVHLFRQVAEDLCNCRFAPLRKTLRRARMGEKSFSSLLATTNFDSRRAVFVAAIEYVSLYYDLAGTLTIKGFAAHYARANSS